MTSTQDAQDYYHLPMRKVDLAHLLLRNFARWFEQAAHKGELEPSAMTLATVDKHYAVTARMVLLKSFDENGFVFFTNYLSLKAKQLEQIPHAALVFWWPKCQRQVRITGDIQLATSQQSDTYFKQRSKESQIAAMISVQSAPITDRSVLLEKYQQLAAENNELKRPDFWAVMCLKRSALSFGKDVSIACTIDFSTP